MKAKASAHINYILYRKDTDERTEDGRSARKMFSQDSDNYLGYHLKEEIQDLKRGDVVHKLIISPGHNDVDLKSYVREVMGELGRAKGLDLRYGFVIHENTDHRHAHVVLLGRDADDKIVRLDKHDHMRLRAFGDRYLEREHNLERVMDKDMEMYCRTHNLNIMHEKERGDLFYERLFKDDKKEGRNAADAHLEWEKFNTDWKKFIEDREGIEKGPNISRYDDYHQLGRMSDLLAFQDNDAQREFWQNLAEERPDLKELAEEKLAQINEDRAELQKDINDKTQVGNPWRTLDQLSDNMASDKRQLDRLLDHGVGPVYNDSGIDLTRVDREDKVEIAGHWYTKYDPVKDLQTAEPGDRTQEPEKYDKLDTWIGCKERFGDDFFGEGPRREEREQEQSPAELNKVPELERGSELVQDPPQYFLPSERTESTLDLEDLEQKRSQEEGREQKNDPFEKLDEFLHFDESDSAKRDEPLLDIAGQEDRADTTRDDLYLSGATDAGSGDSSDQEMQQELENQQIMADMSVFENPMDDKDERDDFELTGM